MECAQSTVQRTRPPDLQQHTQMATTEAFPAAWYSAASMIAAPPYMLISQSESIASLPTKKSCDAGQFAIEGCAANSAACAASPSDVPLTLVNLPTMLSREQSGDSGSPPVWR